MIRRLLSRLGRRDDQLSAGWLRDQARQMERIDWHSARMQWPVKKIQNESAIWNKAKLRKAS